MCVPIYVKRTTKIPLNFQRVHVSRLLMIHNFWFVSFSVGVQNRELTVSSIEVVRIVVALNESIVKMLDIVLVFFD